jgi:RHS repeat-associated protein
MPPLRQDPLSRRDMPSSACEPHALKCRIGRMQSCVVALLVTYATLFANLAHGQVNPDQQQGLAPYQSFQGGAIDQVNLFNGNPYGRVPIVNYPQRGKLRFSFSLNSNNKGWTPILGQGAHWSFLGPVAAIGLDDSWSGGVQILATPCQGAAGYTSFTLFANSSDGGAHQEAVLTPGGYSPQCWPGGNFSLETIDGTGVRYNSTAGTLIDRDGIIYPGSPSSDPNRINVTEEDPNGNKITYSGPGPYQYTDSLGRVIPDPGFAWYKTPTTNFSGCTGPLPIASAETWSPPGPNGGILQFKFCHVTIALKTNFQEAGITEFSGNAKAIQSIVLPNGTAWTYEFGPSPSDPPGVNYGDLTKITFPTGGSISYTYINSRYSRFVATRATNANDGAGPHTWTYTWPAISVLPTQMGSTLQTVVTNPLGNDEVHTFTLFDTWRETQYQFYQGSRTSGSLLKTITTDWTPASTNSVFPIRSTTILANGSTSKVEQDYDQLLQWGNGTSSSYGNVIAERAYDFGSGASGPLLKTTTTNYQAFNNTTYLTKNLLNIPTNVSIYDGSGNLKSSVSYSYDGTARASSGVTTNRDTSPPNAPYYGNPTSISRWESGSTVATTSCSLVVSNGNLTTNNIFYDTGTLNQTTDPCGHNSTFLYSSTFAGAYPTTTTNALSQSTVKTYDFNTGLLTSSKDPNNLTTSYTYDNMLRVSQVNYPDGGQINVNHQESTYPFTVSLTKKITSSQNLVTMYVFDGFGRVPQTQLISDPQGTVYSDTTYDALGRIRTQSNPHRSGSAPTDGTTTFYYDALGRTCLVVPPDGTLPTGGACPTSRPTGDVLTAYSGNAVTATDQAGNSRKTVFDSLGRLTQVFEDPAGLNYETDYAYDALDNLLTVNQKGGSTNSANWRTRTFAYDSLSQLTSSTNPESNTQPVSPFAVVPTSYAYDANGNLSTKSAPAPNQTGTATVTTTYAHDALNRLTQKSYSDSTPVVKYGYDAIAPSGCTLPTLTIGNGIGKRTGMCDAAGAEAWSYDITAGTGWKLTDARTTNSVSKSTIVQNNLAGSAATLTYPSGRTITYALDAAARPISAVDSTGPITYATAAGYAPIGALSSLTNGASVVSTLYFNNRLQPCRISVKNTGTAPANCTDAVNIGNVLDFTYNFSLGTANNGNVTAITNNRDNTRSQSFAYDSLNRISTANTTSTTGATCWDEAFGYDSWGNLLTIGRITGYACSNEELLNASATPQNRVSGNTYDTAGDLTSIPAIATYTFNAENQLTSAAGVTYTYDGDGKRVKKSSGKLYWFGMGSDPLDETDLAGNTNNTSFNEYIFFGGKRIARRDSSSNVTYYFSDHLGTARIVANSSGAPVDDSDFYPFGGERVYTNSGPQNYKFTGKERDSESGLDNFGARYDSSQYCRFMTPDSHAIDSQRIADPQRLNLYAYARNNPLLYVDPDGKDVKVFTERLGWSSARIASLLRPRHTFIRVTTPTRDVVIELGGPTKDTSPKGNPIMKDVHSDSDVTSGRKGVEEEKVTRPGDSPKGDFKFEERIIEGFERLKNSLPNYNGIDASDLGPNSNGFANFLVTSSGGSVDLPLTAFAKDDTAPYQLPPPPRPPPPPPPPPCSNDASIEANCP